jgi:hypothetical protein
MRLSLVEEVDPASAKRFLEAYRAVGGDPDVRRDGYQVMRLAVQARVPELLAGWPEA